MTTVIFVRHGYSEGNMTDSFHGHTDGDLTPLGHKQAALAAQYLKNRKIDALYSSDLQRAYKTALHIADELSLDIVKDKRLREIMAGEWEGKKFSELEELFPEEYKIWFNDPGNFVSPGGESMKQLYDRMTSTVADIVKQNKDKTIVIATHATPIRTLNCHWMGKDVCAFNETEWVSNASICEINYEIKDDGSVVPHPVCINYCEHLGELSTRLADNI